MTTKNRYEWEFPVAIQVVIEGANRLADYHRQRLTHWREELAKVETDIRAQGINIDQIPVTGGYHGQLVVRADLLERWQLARNKIRTHEGFIAEFVDFLTGLSLARGEDEDTVMLLTQDDLHYFDIGETGEREE
jgi:hypothetical protein